MSQQTSYAVPALGYPGMLMGSMHKKHSVVNDLGASRQTVDVTIDNVINATTYTFTVDGVVVSFTSDASATVAEIRDGLIAAGRALEALNGVVIFQPDGNDVRVIAAVPGTGFTLAETDANLSINTITANTSTEAVPFGRALVKRTGAGTTDQSVRLPSAASQIFMGVAAREHGLVDVTNGTDQVKPFSVISAVHSGDVVVQVEEAIAVGDNAFFRHTAAGTEAPGEWRNDADGGDCDQVTGARFMSSTTGRGLAILRLP